LSSPGLSRRSRSEEYGVPIIEVARPGHDPVRNRNALPGYSMGLQQVDMAQFFGGISFRQNGRVNL
jgi:hypothetical protein